MSLKSQLIKLGSENPNLQKHIRPVLDKISKTVPYDEVKGGKFYGLEPGTKIDYSDSDEKSRKYGDYYVTIAHGMALKGGSGRSVIVHQDLGSGKQKVILGKESLREIKKLQ